MLLLEGEEQLHANIGSSQRAHLLVDGREGRLVGVGSLLQRRADRRGDGVLRDVPRVALPRAEIPDVVVQLGESLGKPSLGRIRRAKRMGGRGVDVEDGEVVAWLDFMITFTSATVMAIGVKPEYRKRGIATSLMKKMEEICQRIEQLKNDNETFGEEWLELSEEESEQ